MEWSGVECSGVQWEWEWEWGVGATDGLVATSDSLVVANE